MSRYIDEENSITHYGVLGMKWGIRRYQPYSYTGGGSGKEVGEAAKKSKAAAAKEKIKSAVKTYKTKKKMAKLRKAKAEKAKRLAAEAAAKDRKEKEVKALKEKITKDAVTLNRNQELARKLLTNDEYNKIKDRLQSEQQVYELAKKKNDRARQTIEDVLKYSQTGIKVYNSLNTWDKILNDEKKSDPVSEAAKAAEKATKTAEKATKAKKDSGPSFKEAFRQYKEASRNAKQQQEWDDWFEDIVRNVEYVEPQLLLEDKKKR